MLVISSLCCVSAHVPLASGHGEMESMWFFRGICVFDSEYRHLCTAFHRLVLVV